MVTCNNMLHAGPIDDTMSGTTAIALLIRGRTVHVANVGDSRAVLAVKMGDNIVAHDLSHDQTPFRFVVVLSSTRLRPALTAFWSLCAGGTSVNV
jgi:serine/threonine protein phosphatase PrpC